MKLKPDEIKCDLCDGEGERNVITKIADNGQFIELKTCKKCGGEGKLDWIEMVVGKHDVKVYTRSIIFNSKPGWD